MNKCFGELTIQSKYACHKFELSILHLFFDINININQYHSISTTIYLKDHYFPLQHSTVFVMRLIVFYFACSDFPFLSIEYLSISVPLHTILSTLLVKNSQLLKEGCIGSNHAGS